MGALTPTERLSVTEDALQLQSALLSLAAVQVAVAARSGVGVRVLRPGVEALEGATPRLVYGVVCGGPVSHTSGVFGTRPG
jgi:hypothetical protein